MSRLYGLGEFEAQDYEAVAAVYGVTGERIRQIEAKAIRKIYQSGPDDSD
jgi:DNA-directed RNA polymerase sigma subunit (sigma70/sigma32)